MADLKTNYMGIELKNPVIAGASRLTSDLDSLKKLEEAGAGAVVTKSLFEEQIELERFKFDEDREKNNNKYSEMIDIFPDTEFPGPKEHLYWVKKTKETLSIPVIASLNAVHEDTWVDYAKQLMETGVDGLELNLYSSPNDITQTGASYEKNQLELLTRILKEINIPVTVKLSPFYSNPLNFISQVDKTGVNGVVLFNRFFQPDIDIRNEENTYPINLSYRNDNKLPLRYAALSYDQIQADICCSGGIFEGEDAAKMLLVGADAVQVVSTLFINGTQHISKILEDLNGWMDKKGYGTIRDFQGKLSKSKARDPWQYTRSQYAKLLMNPDEILNNDQVI